MRTDLVTYWSLPFYRAMIERSGFGDDIAAFDAGMQAGDVETRASAAISDGFLDSLTAIGSPEDVRAGVDALPRGRRDVAVRRRGAAHRLRGDARSAAAGALRKTFASWTDVAYLGNVTDGVFDSQRTRITRRLL